MFPSLIGCYSKLKIRVLVLEELRMKSCWCGEYTRIPTGLPGHVLTPASRPGPPRGPQGILGCYSCRVQIRVLIQSSLGFSLRAFRLYLLDGISYIRAPRCEFFLTLLMQYGEQIEGTHRRALSGSRAPLSFSVFLTVSSPWELPRPPPLPQCLFPNISHLHCP